MAAEQAERFGAEIRRQPAFYHAATFFAHFIIMGSGIMRFTPKTSIILAVRA
jgi:hypothetical protein